MLRHLRLSTGSLSCNDQCGTAAMTRLLGAAEEGVKAEKGVRRERGSAGDSSKRTKVACLR
jgi:hypothetical protein